MKYIMFHKNGRDIPIIFPANLVHQEIAIALEPLLGKEVVSAGEISPLSMECHGNSTTLGLKAREEDTETIQMIDYFYGIKT